MVALYGCPLIRLDLTKALESGGDVLLQKRQRPPRLIHATGIGRGPDCMMDAGIGDSEDVIAEVRIEEGKTLIFGVDLLNATPA